METVLIKNVKLYKTFRHNENSVWGVFDVEFKGNLARVHNNVLGFVFGQSQTSRYNKLHWLGSTGAKELYYELKVNGEFVYMCVDYHME